MWFTTALFSTPNWGMCLISTVGTDQGKEKERLSLCCGTQRWWGRVRSSLVSLTILILQTRKYKQNPWRSGWKILKAFQSLS